jgi:hypothetical protein
VEVVESRAFVRLAAIVVAVVLTGLAVFQVALIAGAPLGRAAWGGTSTYLPKRLRIASAITIVIYVLGALLVLRRAGFPIRWISPAFARWGTWAFVIILTLAGLGELPFTESLGTLLIGAYGPASGRVVPHRCD